MSIQTKTSSPTRLLSQINSDYLTCQICMDTYRQPKVLKCQHTFCQKCLESCKTSESGSYMSCPVCREKTVLGMNGVSGLKDNFAFSSMIEALETWNNSRLTMKDSTESSDGNDTECNTCPPETGKTAKCKCLDCLENFCESCAAFHQRTKLTKDHEVVLIDDIHSDVYENKIRWREQSRCEEHEAFKMHYCFTCENPVCKDCIIENHQSHDLKTIEEAAEEKKELVVQLEKELAEDKILLTSQLNKAEARRSEEHATLIKYQQEIADRVEQIKLMVMKKHDQLLEELKSANTINMSKIEGRIENLTMQTKCIENCTQLSSHIIKADIPYEILSMYKQIQDTAEHLKAENRDVTKRIVDKSDSLLRIKVQFPDLTSFDISLGRVEGGQDTGNSNVENPANTISQPISTTSMAPPKVVPRRNVLHTDKTPKPAARSTQLITAKEMAALNEALKSSKAPESNNQHHLSLPHGGLVRTKSLERMPLSEKKVTGNATQSEQAGTLPVRRPKPPRPNIQRPKTAPKPPPQKSKPQARKVDPLPLRGVLYTKFGKKGKILTNGEFTGPAQHVIFSKIKFKIFALDAESRHILVFRGDGVFKKSFKVAFADNTLKAVGMAESLKKHIIVLFKKFVTEWAWDGRLVSRWGDKDLLGANCVATDTKDRIIVSDQEKHKVFIYDAMTKAKVMQIGGYGDGHTLFKSPRYICTSKSDNILVSDHHNHCIKAFKSSGSFLMKCGGKGSFDGELKYPEGIDTVQLADGSEGIVVADEGNSRISLFTSKGKFLGHILTTADDKNLKSPQTISISHTGHEMVVKQANQVGLKVFQLSTVGG